MLRPRAACSTLTVVLYGAVLLELGRRPPPPTAAFSTPSNPAFNQTRLYSSANKAPSTADPHWIDVHMPLSLIAALARRSRCASALRWLIDGAAPVARPPPTSPCGKPA